MWMIIQANMTREKRNCSQERGRRPQIVFESPALLPESVVTSHIRHENPSPILGWIGIPLTEESRQESEAARSEISADCCENHAFPQRCQVAYFLATLAKSGQFWRRLANFFESFWPIPKSGLLGQIWYEMWPKVALFEKCRKVGKFFTKREQKCCISIAKNLSSKPCACHIKMMIQNMAPI